MCRYKTFTRARTLSTHGGTPHVVCRYKQKNSRAQRRWRGVENLWGSSCSCCPAHKRSNLMRGARQSFSPHKLTERRTSSRPSTLSRFARTLVIAPVLSNRSSTHKSTVVSVGRRSGRAGMVHGGNGVLSDRRTGGGSRPRDDLRELLLNLVTVLLALRDQNDMAAKVGDHRADDGARLRCRLTVLGE